MIHTQKSNALHETLHVHIVIERDDNTIISTVIAAIDSPDRLINVTINENLTYALLNTGSDKTFITSKLLRQWKFSYDTQSTSKVSLADNSTLKLKVSSMVYYYWLEKNDDLVAPVIIGMDVFTCHSSFTINFKGNKEPLKLCLATKSMKCSTYALIPGIDINKIKPVATTSRRIPKNVSVITDEINRLLKKDIIQVSRSPWRAQCFVVSTGNKNRLVIDYSNTINLHTPLDSYPTPRIDDLILKIAVHKIFSTIDLKSAYHQVRIRPEDYKLTAFEANGKLYEFKRLPFGCTNAVRIFQRVMDEFIQDNKLENTYAYLDDIIIGGKDAQEHDKNLSRFLHAAKIANIEINEEKSNFKKTHIEFLGHIIENGTIKPDPKRYEALMNMPEPRSLKELNRMIGLFAYYAKWIHNCTALALPLTQARDNFPTKGLTPHAKEAIKILKNKLVEACLASPYLKVSLTIETDASDSALEGTLLQLGRPVAFFSRTLTNAERKHAIVEKEAAAIVECCRRWRHLINSVPYINIITDQRSISLNFNKQNATKIKNEKSTRWRLELADINYTISYRPGNQNIVADALSRCCSIVNNTKAFYSIHSQLCHPGVTRMIHYCKTRNLPYSTAEIKQLTNQCTTCNELKPRFYKPPTGRLTQATRPWERLSMDFVGPLQSTTTNKYILVVVDEYSRYPFAFPCQDISAETVIRHLLSFFSLFGAPSSIHTDRGTQFESLKIKVFLEKNGVIKTRTTPYHPQGNGQCERINGTILQAVSLALKTLSLGKEKWEIILQMALSSIRGLLCTVTNETPHQRMMNFQRASIIGTVSPNFLTEQDSTILYRRQVRMKGVPLVDRVQLLETISPHYARIKFQNGKIDTVSTKDLAPLEDLNPPTESVQQQSGDLNIEQMINNTSNSINRNQEELNETNEVTSSQLVENSIIDSIPCNQSPTTAVPSQPMQKVTTPENLTNIPSRTGRVTKRPNQNIHERLFNYGLQQYYYYGYVECMELSNAKDANALYSANSDP
ncbi:uncharacterized protein LOC136074274 [Hydra vulgaris]|uniref:RNA-directed DNA polymerase n=1 Tax=Hydra vulgaris TaxID=6087 RepID=A0ABM4B1I0_HYDVU